MKAVFGVRDICDYVQTENDVAAVELWDDERLVARVSCTDATVDLGEILSYSDCIDEAVIGYGWGSDVSVLRSFSKLEKVWIRSHLVLSIDDLLELPQLKSLSIDRPNCRMDIVGALSTLEELYLDDWRPGTDSIFRLERLRRVGLQKYGHTDLHPMESWARLEELWINSGKLRKLSGIPGSLSELSLTTQRSLDEIKAISCCSSLARLTLQSCRKLTSIEGLQGCKQLAVLSAFQIGTFATIEPLRDHNALHYLVLTQGAVDKDTDVSALYTLRSLQTLIIDRKVPIDLAMLHQQNPRIDIRLVPLGRS